jgi:membrane associated rhomboid family serine protease
MVIGMILIVIVGVEALLQAADAGLIGTRRWRSLAYQFGAFWPGLLADWQPNFPGQAGVMFISYAFLHSGLEHLVGNAVTLWALGRVVCARAGGRGFALAFGLTSLGGALCFAALSPGPQPMVGSSGALFGIAGVWLGWQWQARRTGTETLRLLAIVLGLIAANVLLYWWYDGRLAWATHLGGFVTGLALSGWLGRADSELTNP